MKPARIILLLVAVLAGGLAAFLATRGGDTPVEVTETQVEVREEPRSRVLVSTRAIGLGQRLTEGDVRWQEWPQGAVRPEYIIEEAAPQATTDVVGAVARFEIFSGEPIRQEKLVNSRQGYLSAVINEGMRAVSIGVDAESASGGFVVPNDRVDVIMTRANGNMGASGVSETILSNVRVLAIGNRIGELGETGAAESEDGEEDPRSQQFDSNQIATLETSPSQAETVLNAAENGRLALVLRSVADFDESQSATDSPNQTVRMIRYGRENAIMAGASSRADAANTMSAPPQNAGVAPPMPMQGQPAPSANGPQQAQGPSQSSEVELR